MARARLTGARLAGLRPTGLRLARGRLTGGRRLDAGLAALVAVPALTVIAWPARPRGVAALKTWQAVALIAVGAGSMFWRRSRPVTVAVVLASVTAITVQTGG